MATTYLSSAGLDQIAAAQAGFDAHVTVSASGRCRSCGVEGPCVEQLRSARTLASYGRLPQRTPGATQPERIGHRTPPFRVVPVVAEPTVNGMGFMVNELIGIDQTSPELSRVAAVTVGFGSVGLIPRSCTAIGAARAGDRRGAASRRLRWRTCLPLGQVRHAGQVPVLGGPGASRADPLPLALSGGGPASTRRGRR
ncbi:hypothetical protein [Plantactinospora sp. B24E8]|uniref:hypothetical protein n=1 Tax=Plantactinospora sp. B24E8 TaxID=3153567 RepID=UPI00325EE4E5